VGFSTPFIRRPVGTFLLALGLLIAGAVAYRFLPVAPLPSVDIPAIVVFASRPGADPETMANSVAAPLERRLGEIAGVTELTSVSSTGSTSIVILFDVNRDIDAAAHDVQAAINAALPDLPSELPSRPYYRKFNPADAPIMTIALTSDTLSAAQLFDAADSVLAQRLSQVNGVANVAVNGAEKPAVRVRLNPAALNAAGLTAQDVVTTIRNANAAGPLGGFQGPARASIIDANSQLTGASQYAGLVLKAEGGAVLRLSDVASVADSVANTRLAAWSGNRPAILLTVSKQSGANIIHTVDSIRRLLPQLAEWMPAGVHMTVIVDRTQTIRASVDDVQITLLITIALVLLVVLLFMRHLLPTLAAGVTVPLSIAGTLAAMWMLGFSLDNFSLMAITISVGFVVDDAIVMIENIFRHMEDGKPPLRAAIDGAREIGFTVMSISLSLVAVFIPLLFMTGILGRLLHEFAMTLTVSIAVSAAVSLTLTPMICGRFMRPLGELKPPGGLFGRIDRATGRALAGMHDFYADTLGWALRHQRFMLLVTLATVVLTIGLYREVPKGFMPLEDTGLLLGSTLASPDISFKAMEKLQREVVNVLLADPAVASVGSTIGVTSGFSSLNRGQLTVGLKPLAERGVSSEAVIARLRPKLARIDGMQVFLFSAQDLRFGGRSGGSQFQFVLLAEDLATLRTWAGKLEAKLRTLPGIADVTSDQDRAGPQAQITIDRDAAARLGVTANAVDTALNNAYSQRQVSTIYGPRNQYKVVVEIDPRLQADPSMLSHIWVPTTGGGQVPLSAVTRLSFDTAPVSVRHQGQFPAATISFNTIQGVALGDATALVQRTADELRMPDTVRTEFAGNAKLLAQSLQSIPLLLVAALIAIYIVLGVLYESLIQPLTILSTIPSAGLGALLALLLTHTDLSVIAMIAIVLLMGIVKKNAIMMIDFALAVQRHDGLSPEHAIHAACLARFRPIMMTTLAAILGAVPLAVGFGAGAELRQPLGIAIIGGLVVSQMLTLYTTPVVYLALERLAGRHARQEKAA
jgi:multidrug efflux pump